MNDFGAIILYGYGRTKKEIRRNQINAFCVFMELSQIKVAFNDV